MIPNTQAIAYDFLSTRMRWTRARELEVWAMMKAARIGRLLPSLACLFAARKTRGCVSNQKTQLAKKRFALNLNVLIEPT